MSGSLSKLTGYVVLNTAEALSKLTAYALLSPGETLSKLTAYAVLSPAVTLSKLTAYAVLGFPLPVAFGPIPVFPVLPEGFPIRLSIVMDTTLGTTKSLRETRINNQVYPLWDIEIPFYELRDQTQNQIPYSALSGFQDYEELCQLWLMMYGQTNVFAFDAPWDNSRSEQLIGAGDGVTTSFLVYRSWGTGPSATLAPIGMINTISQVKINGLIVPSSQYSTNRDRIIFTTPPGNGLSITMTFTFYYLCRFVEDEQNFEEFSKNRWTVPSLKFRAVYWA